MPVPETTRAAGLVILREAKRPKDLLDRAALFLSDRARPGGRGVPSVVGRDQRPWGATCGGSAAAYPLPYGTVRAGYGFAARKSSTVLMNIAGWSTKVIWPLCGKMTSFDPAIFSCITRESDGSHSS